MPAVELDTRSLAYTTLKTLNDRKDTNPEAAHDFCSDYDYEDDAFAPEAFSKFFGDIISEADVEAALAQLNAECVSEQAETIDKVWENKVHPAQEKPAYLPPIKETKVIEESEQDDACVIAKQEFQPLSATQFFNFRNGVRAAVVACYVASVLSVRINPNALFALQIICIFCFFRLM